MVLEVGIMLNIFQVGAEGTLATITLWRITAARTISFCSA